MKEALAAIKAKLSGGGSSAMPSSMPPPAPVVPGAKGSEASALLTLLFALFYFVPVLGMQRRDHAYRLALCAAGAGLAVSLWRTWPKAMATLKDARFLQSDETQALPLLVRVVWAASRGLVHTPSRAHPTRE